MLKIFFLILLLARRQPSTSSSGSPEEVSIRRRPPNGAATHDVGSTFNFLADTLIDADGRYQENEDNKPRNILEEIVWYKEVEIAQVTLSVPHLCSGWLRMAEVPPATRAEVLRALVSLHLGDAVAVQGKRVTGGAEEAGGRGAAPSLSCPQPSEHPLASLPHRPWFRASGPSAPASLAARKTHGTRGGFPHACARCRLRRPRQRATSWVLCERCASPGACRAS